MFNHFATAKRNQIRVKNISSIIAFDYTRMLYLVCSNINKNT